jgi:hypothetical protein
MHLRVRCARADVCRSDPRGAERWRGLRMTEFERRQLIANRNELDRAHGEQTAPAVNGKLRELPASSFQGRGGSDGFVGVPHLEAVGRPPDDVYPPRPRVSSARPCMTGRRRTGPSLFALSLLMRLPQAHPGPTAIAINEIDAGGF